MAALALPLGPLAQAKDEPKSPAVSSSKQAIIKKLETIRLDSVRYDGLPLIEVVRNLWDEAKKRDPEKKGINFLVNPLPPPESTVATAPVVGPDGLPAFAPPPEPVDVGGIAIRIDPPLSDVRLVDVLDAVVKMAERPIKFTIEDYGVVFSLRDPEPARKADMGFSFPGGTPAVFLQAVQSQFKVDWASVADIPPEMADVRIPKLRIPKDSLGRFADAEEAALEAVVTLYNQLGAQKPALGRLIVEGNPAKPSVVMFVADKSASAAQPKNKVRAFSIDRLNDGERAKLQEDIERARKEAMRFDSRQGSAGPRSPEGTVAVHSDTGLLVVAGSESFVDMVESIVAAWQAKLRAGSSEAPMVLPTPPGK